MVERLSRNLRVALPVGFVLALAMSGATASVGAQGGRGGGGGGQQSARAAAPIDMTGYWVAIVTEDWRFRMVTPPKGDYNSVPLNAEGRKVADTWDPARDEAAGEQCKWYGAGGIMSVPGRLNITWQDDNTLRMDIDTGTQTRLFRFGGSKPATAAPDWQGYSEARWRMERGGGEAVSKPGGSLNVVTTGMRPGYLRKNGVPYSANARITEHYNVLQDGDVTWLIVSILVEDPQYLQQPFITSRQFMKQTNNAGWKPTPCSAR
jgi:hypothetical protein